MLQLLSDQTVSGITAGFDTFVTAMSIAYGLMVATVLLPDGVRRRRAWAVRAAEVDSTRRATRRRVGSCCGGRFRARSEHAALRART